MINYIKYIMTTPINQLNLEQQIIGFLIGSILIIFVGSLIGYLWFGGKYE